MSTDEASDQARAVPDEVEAEGAGDAATADERASQIGDELDAIEGAPLAERGARYQSLVDRLREALEQSDPAEGG
ncbi:hypothetical protein FLP10_01590 [Agromyces intestinalis]|uniref:Uncharacterized protein n=1 Tax=Agromyces intestinalis TaxID=2592652 RepID=A0A5C1YAQ9_9MICO|nr:hypothetical protein [Agromyces intestinalis]QEO13253.1 hypothetical protein FLP10_01590 [Agromyces intestinalis]